MVCNTLHFVGCQSLARQLSFHNFVVIRYFSSYVILPNVVIGLDGYDIMHVCFLMHVALFKNYFVCRGHHFNVVRFFRLSMLVA
jgi:hypothetical protein